ncbi:MAG: GxxExxY protein [Caldilineales bacterium]|nr:GxxExxY protein [Caldilineales bacterium]
METHRILCPGYLEAVYQAALAHELNLRNIPFEAQKEIRVEYKGVEIGYYKADFVVDDQIILELKATSALTKKDQAQAMHYLTATGHRLAILHNFGTQSLEHRRVVK